MVDNRCSKKYPRSFNIMTTVDSSGYPLYMRRDSGRTTLAKRFVVDNRWVVPYNPFLSQKYNAHINVEICSTVKAVKYIYKYVYKGHDKALFSLLPTHSENDAPYPVMDEIR